jgi:GAF domain-containing protein
MCLRPWCLGDVEDPLTPGFDRPLEYRRIQALQDLHLLSEPAAPALRDLCQHAQERFGVAAVLVTLIDTDRQIIKVGVGTDLEQTPRPDAFCDHLLWSDKVLVVPDARQDDRFATNPLVKGKPFIRFYAGAPLIFMRDVRLGGFCLLDTRPRDFTDREQAELADFAEEAMICIIEQELDRFAPGPRV